MNDKPPYRPVAEPPVRLCCMTRHHGVACPDQTFMCCVCFGKVPVKDAYTTASGERIDACQECGPLVRQSAPSAPYNPKDNEE